MEDMTQRAACERFLLRTPTTIAWEPRLSHLGHLIQGYAYSFMLDKDQDLTGPLTAWGAFETTHVPLFDRVILNTFKNVFKAQMRSIFSLSDPKVTQHRKREIDHILDEADKALAASGNTFLVTTDYPTYIDIGFSSLMAPMLGPKILFCKPSKYAKGRFPSFEAAAGWVPPQGLVDYMEGLEKRPCGRFVLKMFEEWRGKRIWD